MIQNFTYKAPTEANTKMQQKLYKLEIRFQHQYFDF